MRSLLLERRVTMLKDRIKQYGIEIEYPLDGNRDNLPRSTIRKYGVHYDGGGLEFTTPQPLSLKDILDEVDTIYGMCEDLVDSGAFHISEYHGAELWECDTNGIHIRIDVSSWTKQERLRFLRLFSTDMSSYSSFTDWMSDNFRRGWQNYNRPASYSKEYYSSVRHDHSSEKFLNAKYEANRYGAYVYTIEIRAFGVPQDVNKVKKMFDFIHTLCEIVDKSLTYTGDTSIPLKLLMAWNEVVNHIMPTISTTDTATQITEE